MSKDKPDEIILGNHVNGRGDLLIFRYVSMEGRDDNGKVAVSIKAREATSMTSIEMTEMGFMMVLIDAAKQSKQLRFCLRKILAESEPVEGDQDAAS